MTKQLIKYSTEYYPCCGQDAEWKNVRVERCQNMPEYGIMPMWKKTISCQHCRYVYEEQADNNPQKIGIEVINN